tara:strand:- start:8632 stop:9819 length:1188 start_codon:yes stop_codon:yes gene_type:complete
MTKETQHNRIQALDGLRAFAIIFVLLSHSSWKYSAQITLKLGDADFHNLIYNGWMGVDLFFVLSGFLIASQLLNRDLIKNNLKFFIARRFFRIAPTYYVAILITLFAYYIIPMIGTVPAQDLVQKWWFPVVAHFIFLHDYIGRDPSINGLFWSIPIEIKFYLVLPFLLMFITKLSKPTHRTLFVGGLFCLYVLCKTWAVYLDDHASSVTYSDYFLLYKTPFHFSLDGLIIGVLCAFILQNTALIAKWREGAAPNILFALGFALFAVNALSPHFTNDTATFFEQTLMTSLFALSFGLMLLGVVLGCFATGFLSAAFLRFIAKISYSMYLTHIFAISLQTTLVDMLSPYITAPTLCWLLILPIFFGVATAMAYIMHITVEQPFLRWSKEKFKYSESA